MNRFDPDTIAALAEGRLSSDETARLEREIANDPAALAELEMHRTALTALAAAAALHLSDLERSGLRASVAEAIGLVEPDRQAAVAPRRVPWGSLGIAAAALFGLVAVVPVVGLLNTSGGGDDAAETALAPAATTTADLTIERVAESDGVTDEAADIATGDAFDAGQEAPGEDVVGFGSTTMAARATTTSTSTTAPQTTTSTAPEAAVETTTTLASTAELTPLDQLVADLTALREDSVEVEAIATEALEEDSCWGEDTAFRGGEDPGDRWRFEYVDDDQVFAVYFQYTEEGLLGPFTVYTTPDCVEYAVVPEAP